MKILFVCKSNAERSPVAEAFFNAASRKNKAYSAGVMVKKERTKGWRPGRIVTELMLGLGYNLNKHRRMQLTKKIFDKMDRVIILFSDLHKYPLPSYVKNSSKTEYWNVGNIDLRVYDGFPPYTYYYHVKGILKEKELVERLVKKIG